MSAPQFASIQSKHYALSGISGGGLGNTLSELQPKVDAILSKTREGVALAPYQEGLPSCSHRSGEGACIESFSFDGDSFQLSLDLAVKTPLSTSVNDALGEALAKGLSVSLVKPPTAPVLWRGILFETEVQPNRYSPNPDPLEELGSGRNYKLLRYPNGNVKMGVLAKDAVIQGVEINQGRLVFFYPEGQLQKVSGLGAARKVKGVEIGSRDILYFKEDGSLDHMEPVDDPMPRF